MGIIIVSTMEIKKSNTANLESQRLTAFLLGVILVLSFAIVALEYNSADDASQSADIDFDLLMDDAEMMPIAQDEEIVAIETPSEEEAVNDEVIAVDNDADISLPEEVAGSDGVASEEVAPAEEIVEDEVPATINPLHFRVVEDLPQYPGGATEFIKWLSKNLRYPAKAKKAGVEGKVVVQFIVEKDGSISNLEVVKSVDASLDNEALRVMRKMPNWTPGIQNDEPCRTLVSVPIVFHL